MKEPFRTVVREALYEVFEEEVRQLSGASHHPKPQAVFREVLKGTKFQRCEQIKSLKETGELKV
jgi:hypothetical protein